MLLNVHEYSEKFESNIRIVQTHIHGKTRYSL